MERTNKRFILLVVGLVIIILFMGNGIISYAVANRVFNKFVGPLGSRIEFLEKQQAAQVESIKELQATKVEADLFKALISIVYKQNQILRDMGEAARIQNVKRYNMLLTEYESLNAEFQSNFWKVRAGSE